MPTGSTTWSDGLRMTGERDLSPAERAELRRTALRFRAQGCLGGVAVPLLFIAFLVGLSLFTDPSATPGPAFVLAAIAGLALLGVLCLGAVERMRWGLALARDVSEGRVERFETPREPSGPHGTAEGAGEWAAGCLEVLPNSGMVYQVDGVRSRGWSRVTRTEIADPPPFARIAAEWLEPAETDDGTAIHLGHRELSEAEEGEIRRRQRHLLLKPGILALLLSLWTSPILWFLAREGKLPEGRHLVSFILLVVLTAVALVQFARSLKLARELAGDLRAGRAVIARSEAATQEDDDGDPEEMPAAEEYLPVSGLLWTRGGEPARWRVKS